MLYIKEWDKNKFKLMKTFETKEPESYIEIMAKIIENILEKRNYKIEENYLGDGYQGDLKLNVKLDEEEFSTLVWYGTCSGCDTLMAIQDEKSKRIRIKDYMMLSLHLMQKMTKK